MGNLACLLSAEAMQRIKAPPLLCERIKAGEHPILIWAAHLHISEKMLADMIGISYEGLMVDVHQSAIQLRRMDGRSVLTFCRFADIHPANLVPMDPDPQLSLPSCIFEANYLVAGDDTATEKDRAFARQAIAIEVERFQSFMEPGRHYEYKKLTEVFSEAIREGHFMAAREVLRFAAYDDSSMLNLAPLALDSMLESYRQKLSKIYNKEDFYDAEFDKAEEAMDAAYEKLFGPVADDAVRTITEYAIALSERFSDAIDGRRGRARKSKELAEHVLQDLIRQDVIEIYKHTPFCRTSPRAIAELLHFEIKDLAGAMRHYFLVEAKVDVRSEIYAPVRKQYKNKVERISQVIDDVTSSSGAFVCYLLRNHAAMVGHAHLLNDTSAPHTSGEHEAARRGLLISA